MAFNLGAALGGYQGQGGLVPQLQANQQADQKRQQMALLYQAMQNSQTPQGVPPQPAPAAAPPSPAQPPQGPGMMPPRPPQAQPQASPPPGAQPTQGLPTQQAQPPADPLTQFTTKLSQSKAPDWMKGEAFQQFMTAYAPVMAQQRDQAREKELERHDQAMELIGQTNAGAHKESADAATTNAGTNVVKANKSPKETSLTQDPQYKALENDAAAKKSIWINTDHNNATANSTAKAAFDEANAKVAAYKTKKETVAAAPAAKGDEAPLITSKEDYDKLPSGATYKEDDGVTYTKP